MCDGASEMFVASMLISAASTAASMKAQADAANVQNASNAQQRVFIDANQRNQTLQAQRQEYYVNQEAGQKLQQNAEQVRSAQATAATAAGEAGVSGLSVDALQREYLSRGDTYATDVDFNRGADINQLQEQMKGFNTTSMSQQSRLVDAVHPSFMDAALRIGGDAVNAYNNTYGKQPKNPATKINDTAS